MKNQNYYALFGLIGLGLLGFAIYDRILYYRNKEQNHTISSDLTLRLDATMGNGALRLVIRDNEHDLEYVVKEECLERK